MGPLRRLTADSRAFFQNEGGNVALIFAFTIPIMLGVMGLGVDTASFYRQQGRMQYIADSAALAVAKELHLYRKNLSELKEVGKARIESMLAQSDNVEPHTVEIRIDPDANLIEVEIAMHAAVLLRVIHSDDPWIKVVSRAEAFGESKLCILGLDPSKGGTINANGAASVTAPDCAVHSNSSAPDGLKVDPDSSITSTVICSSGGAKGGSFTPDPEVDCPQLDDPLSEREPPSFTGCDFLDQKINGGKVSISPGTYCGGLEISHGAEVTAEPGVYIFSLGKLAVKDTSKFLGENVSLYFPDEISVFEFEKDTTIDLTAPKDGPMAGILVYESQIVIKGRDFLIKSEHARRLLGTIYLPNGKLKIDSKGDVADLSAYTVIVAEAVEVKGANLVVNSDYGGTDVPVPDGVGPNSTMARLDR